MMVIHVAGLVKRYGEIVAVDELSFQVSQGELFGLLGPNGAGKTTTIRVIMDILQPDAGEVTVLGSRPADAKERVGYLPEERGLFRDVKVLDTLIYLAELKGVSRADARRRGWALLERVDLDEWADRKVKDLSRGMQQRLQFIASLVHDPDLLILDEPFQGLDPVNTERLKGFVDELREAGKTIVLSTHQMNLVEALCDRILLIHHGQAVLYGHLDAIKEEHAPNTVRLRSRDTVSNLAGEISGVLMMEADDGAFNLTLDEDVDPQDVLRNLVERRIDVREFEVAPVPLEDIFVEVVGREET